MNCVCVCPSALSYFDFVDLSLMSLASETSFTSTEGDVNDRSQLSDTPSVVPKKRRRVCPETPNGTSDNPDSKTSVDSHFCPAKTRLVSVLRNDTRSKQLVLHARFDDSLDKDAIVILEKSSFPNSGSALLTNKVAKCMFDSNAETSAVDRVEAQLDDDFPSWSGNTVMTNDIYHRIFISTGYESVNGVNVTVIHPAEKHHFKKFTGSGRHIVNETREQYDTLVVPFLAQQPRDLSWVTNILSGSAEADRVLYRDTDPRFGFTVVLDYKWNEKQIQELHCLGLASDSRLTCIRDLRGEHVPMLKRMLEEGRSRLAAKYTTTTTDDSAALSPDQLLAFLHYPPSFYHLHVHFVNVNIGDSFSLRSDRAHLVEEVIRNLEMDGNYYANRVLTFCLHDNSPMLELFRPQQQQHAPPQEGEEEAKGETREERNKSSASHSSVADDEVNDSAAVA